MLNGGLAFFVVDSDNAVQIGQMVQRRYHKETCGGSSITYAIQPIPDCDPQKLMVVAHLGGNMTKKDLLNLLHLRLAKDNLNMGVTPDENAQHDVALTFIASRIFSSPLYARACA